MTNQGINALCYYHYTPNERQILTPNDNFSEYNPHSSGHKWKSFSNADFSPFL